LKPKSGNDQVRFELAFYAIQPSIKIIAPWRESRFFNRYKGRNDLLEYAAETGIPVTSTKAKPWSMDANLAHCSYEAGILEDPNQTPPNDMWTMTNDPLKAPNEPTDITISFQKGIPTKLVTPQKTFTDSVQLFKELNRIGKVHGT
jgi:argininosuccinate synthase